MRNKIIRTGSFIPETKITNFDLEKIMDTSDTWIRQRTGIVSRYFSETGATEMGYQSALKTMEGIDVESIDLLIVCTYTSDTFIPSCAHEIRAKLGIQRPIPAFDLNAACSGFVYGIHVADAMMKTGIYKRALVIGVDQNSRYLNFEDRSTSILFGDGAGAVILESSHEIGIVSSSIFSETDTSSSIVSRNTTQTNNPFLKVDPSDPNFKMEGSTVFKFAVKSFKQCVSLVMNQHDLNSDDIDFVVAHQANQRIIDTAAKMLKMPLEKFPTNLDKYGNTSAASIPIVLDELNRSGQLKCGMKVILVAFGGGLSYGVSYLEW